MDPVWCTVLKRAGFRQEAQRKLPSQPHRLNNGIFADLSYQRKEQWWGWLRRHQEGTLFHQISQRCKLWPLPVRLHNIKEQTSFAFECIWQRSSQVGAREGCSCRRSRRPQLMRAVGQAEKPGSGQPQSRLNTAVTGQWRLFNHLFYVVFSPLPLLPS